jgi:hypothetical protein
MYSFLSTRKKKNALEVMDEAEGKKVDVIEKVDTVDKVEPGKEEKDII